MALRRRVWSAGKLLVLVGALVATYVLFAAASMRLALRAREVKVPDFTNLTANEATAMASGLGLAVHAVIDRSIIWANTRVSQEAVVRRSILGRHCHIGRNASVEDNVVLGDKSMVTDYSRL